MNMLNEHRSFFSTDVFALRQREGALLYAPLLGVIARSNFAGVNLLRRLDRTLDMVLQPSETKFLAQLAELGLTRSAKGIKLSRPDETPFMPRCVSLYLTNACNLRCVYCYASAGDAPKPTVLDFEVGAAGIQHVADLVKQAGEDAFALSFHGAGEPTLAWDSLARLTNYARQVGEQKNLRVSITTCTNGVMSAEHARWLALHTDAATISLDGDAASQNAARPFRSGAASYNHVARTLHIFKEEGFYHSIRATITNENVRQMTGMVDMMADRFSASHLQFDPVLVSGRCLESGCGTVDPDTFAVEFMGAYDRALQRQVELGFSILSLNSQRNYYCCAVSDGFTITHDGLITSCFDVYRPDHPFAGYFIYGSYNRKTKQLDIDHQTLARLRCRNTCRMSSCQACFCKYMCCGDCTVNAMRQGLNLMKGGGRCRITQAIGAFMLAKKIAAIRERIPYCIIADERNDFSLSNAAWADGFGNERPEIFGGVNFPVQESYYMRPPPTEENARQWISDGNAAYRLRDYRKALGQYEKAIQLAPRSADAHNNMALVLHKLGRLPEALGEAEKAVSLSAHTSSSHLTHGKVLVACGRLAEALAAFDRVLALDPGHEGARYNRAWVLAELEKLDEAEGVLSGLTTVADSGSDADVLLQSLRQTQGGSVALTGPSLHRPHAWMIRMNTRLLAGEGVPDDPGDRVKLTSVLDDCSREQYAKARQSMDDLLRSRPSSALLRMLSGMLWQAQGDSGKANADMQMAQGDQR